MAYQTRDLMVRILGDAGSFVAAGKLTRTETEKTQSSLENFASGAKKASLVMAGVGVGLTAYAKSATDFTVSLAKDTNKLSRETGATVQESSRLLYVTGRMGIEADKASQVFGIFSKKIAETRTKSGEMAATQAELNAKIRDAGLQQEILTNKIDSARIKIADYTKEIKLNGDKSGELAAKVRDLQLKTQGYENDLSDLKVTTQNYKTELTAATSPLERLHVATKNADGSSKSFNSILLEVADRFKEMKNGPEKTALALDLFGKSGKDMIKVLNLGSQGIKDLEKKADELGLTLNAKTIGQVSKYIESQKDLKDSTNAVKMSVGELTTPILTNFNNAINKVVLSLLNTDGPMRGVTANVLAFGGPVATATAGISGFAANMIQVVSGLGGMRAAMGAASAFMLGPWGIAIGLAGLAIGGLVIAMFGHKSISEQLTNAQNNLRSATDQLRLSQDGLRQSQVNEAGAALAVEGAQRAYTAAVQQYGPSSLEARQALNNLEQAQLRVKEAHNQTKNMLQQLKDKEREVAKDKELINKLKETRDSLANVDGQALSAGKHIDLLNGRRVTVKTTKGPGGNQVVDFVSTFGRAKGGPVKAGQPYIVGEEGMELFTPKQDGTIIPNDKLTKASGGVAMSDTSSSQPIHIDFRPELQIGMFAGMPTEFREIAERLWLEFSRIAQSNGIKLPTIGTRVQ